MFNRAKNVLDMIQAGDRVLDIGGAAEVFPRANVVIDILPYEERAPGQLKDMAEQFTRADWNVGDICMPDVWQNFRDKEFDFVICSHVLEDIRDPIYVCQQMVRVGKAGYIEVPSRFREMAKAGVGEIVTGWEHHRWFVEVCDSALVFKPKLPYMNAFDYLGDRRRHYLGDYYHNFTAVQWVGSFDYVERVSKGSPIETEDMFNYYEHYPYDRPPAFHKIENVAQRGRTFEWLSDYRLPIEDLFGDAQILSMFNQHLATLRDAQGSGPRAVLPNRPGSIRNLLMNARAAVAGKMAELRWR